MQTWQMPNSSLKGKNNMVPRVHGAFYNGNLKRKPVSWHIVLFVRGWSLNWNCRSENPSDSWTDSGCYTSHKRECSSTDKWVVGVISCYIPTDGGKQPTVIAIKKLPGTLVISPFCTPPQVTRTRRACAWKPRWPWWSCPSLKRRVASTPPPRPALRASSTGCWRRAPPGRSSSSESTDLRKNRGHHGGTGWGFWGQFCFGNCGFQGMFVFFNMDEKGLWTRCGDLKYVRWRNIAGWSLEASPVAYFTPQETGLTQLNTNPLLSDISCPYIGGHHYTLGEIASWKCDSSGYIYIT